MALPSWREELPGRVRGMQIIIAALCLGCIVFLGIAAAIAPSMSKNGDSKLITYVALGFVILAIVPRLVVPAIMVSVGRRKIAGELQMERDALSDPKRLEDFENDAARRLLGLLQGKTIISGALIEGSTFFLLIAYMLERSPIALAGAVLMIVVLAMHFPTVDRTTSWIEDQLKLLREGF